MYYFSLYHYLTREKEQHTQHLRSLEEEIECQVLKTESRVKKEVTIIKDLYLFNKLCTTNGALTH